MWALAAKSAISPSISTPCPTARRGRTPILPRPSLSGRPWPTWHRQAIADQVYKGTYLPLYSNVPSGFLGAIQPFKAYGDGSGKPSADNAKKVLSDAGVTVPVALNLQYNPDHYGNSSGDEYALVKEQLERSGLFKVNLQSTEWVTYTKASRADEYPVFQFGWFPDFSDTDNYLSPFFLENSFLNNHFKDPAVTELIHKQLTTVDKTLRESTIKDAQNALAKDISTLPLLQGAQVAISGSGVNGVDKTLDASFKFRLGAVSK